MFFLWSILFLLIWSLANSDAVAVIPLQFDDDGPFSSNKNPESAYVASLANIAYRSIIQPSTCSSLGIESKVCETFISTVTSKMNIYWAKSDNKTGLRASSSRDKIFIGPENRNVLAIKPSWLSPVFIFFFGERFGHYPCLKDHGRITDHGHGKCLTYCIQRTNYLDPIKTNVCISDALPFTHFADHPYSERNLIPCFDGIIGAASC